MLERVEVLRKLRVVIQKMRKRKEHFRVAGIVLLTLGCAVCLLSTQILMTYGESGKRQVEKRE